MAQAIKYSPLFRKILRSIIDNKKGIYGPSLIKSFINRLSEYTLLLSGNAHIGSIELLLENRKYQYRKVVIKPYFKIIYVITDDYILFADIWDTRQDPKLLTNRVISTE